MKPKLLIIIKYIFLKTIFIFFLPIFLFAQGHQTDFVNIMDINSLNLSSSQLARIKRMKSSHLYNDVYVTSIGNVEKIIKSNGKGTLPIKLPGINGAQVAFPTEFRYTDPDNYYWNGVFNKTDGELSITANDGMVSGQVIINEKNFELVPLSKQICLLIEHNISIFFFLLFY